MIAAGIITFTSGAILEMAAAATEAPSWRRTRAEAEQAGRMKGAAYAIMAAGLIMAAAYTITLF
jgi:hypothetical protein